MMVFRVARRALALSISLFLFTTHSAFAQFPEYFDGVTVPALPADWSGTNGWVTTTATPHTAPNAAFVNDPAVINDARLTTPLFTYTGTGPLRFRNRFNLENGFDGGVLEISINGGAFQDIIAAGGSFGQGGYNGTISVNFGSPIAGRQAWTGNSVNYIVTVVNLPNIGAGSTAQLRWRRGTDSSVSGLGWFVDSVEIGSAAADLQITTTDSADPVVGGTQFTYTMTVTNNGPALADAVEAVQVLAPGSFIQALGAISQGTSSTPFFGVAQANFGILTPGSSASLIITTEVNAFVPLPALFTISSPAELARNYTANRLQFGSEPVTNTVSGNLVTVQDGNGDANDACQNITNAAAIDGNIALLTSSALCGLDEAVARTQGAGAVGAVVVSENTSLNTTFQNNFVVTIPSILISANDGGPILAFLPATVPVTIGSLPGQLLSTAYVNSPTTDTDRSNNIGQQLTAFLNDSDLDTVPDDQDNCDNIANLNQANLDGDALGDLCDFCTDSDGDGSGNPEFILNTCPLDACVSDAGKVFPGVCGCGTADTDSDGDSTPNCTDACPFDGTTTVGVDANKNGILDCQKTQELKFRLNQAQTLLGKLNANFEGTSKAAKKQKKLRKDINTLLKQAQAFVAGGGINGLNVQAISAAAIKSIKKATKAKGKAFKKSKSAALAANANFIGSLGL